LSTSGVAASSSRLPTTKIADYEPCRKLLADKAHPVRGRGTLNKIIKTIYAINTFQILFKKSHLIFKKGKIMSTKKLIAIGGDAECN
jgi:hypothetical protein